MKASQNSTADLLQHVVNEAYDAAEGSDDDPAAAITRMLTVLAPHVDAQAAAIQPSELEAWKVVAAIADTMLWPCRRHEPKGCGENCTACRMVDALHAVGLGHDLKKGTNP